MALESGIDTGDSEIVTLVRDSEILDVIIESAYGFEDGAVRDGDEAQGTEIARGTEKSFETGGGGGAHSRGSGGRSDDRGRMTR